MLYLLLPRQPDAGIMVLFIPSIIFSNSIFQNLLFGSVNGAFLMISESISITDCTFESNSGFQTDGAGLFKLSNAGLSESVVNVLFSDCIFTK